MRPIVTEVTHAVVYVDFALIGHTGEPCENGPPIKMSFGLQTLVGQRNN